MKTRASAFAIVCLTLVSGVAPLRAGQLLAAWQGYLVRLDRDTGQALEIIGAMGAPMNGLAYDARADVVYAVDPASDNVFRVDRRTAQAERLGSEGLLRQLGFDNVNGLTYDSVHDILYATDGNTNTLLAVDRETGGVTVVATISGGFTEIEGLGYDPYTDTLYGITQLQSRIVKIDVQTGVLQDASGPLPNAVWRGLDFDAERRLLYASTIRLFQNPYLYSFNPATRELRFIGEVSGTGTMQGLAGVVRSTLRGDADCDGAVNFGDINPFVLALNDPEGYQRAFPICNVNNADCNGDGKIDFGDINPFVELLSGE